MIAEKIWTVEQRIDGEWHTIAVPVTEVVADIYLSEVAVDLSPADFRKVKYRRVDPGSQGKAHKKTPPEKEHANV